MNRRNKKGVKQMLICLLVIVMILPMFTPVSVSAAEDLFNFGLEGVGIPRVKEELLANEVTLEQIGMDMESSFSEDMFYYEDLSPVGKMVFFYVTPRYVAQFDQQEGSDLWNYCFKFWYEDMWDSIIGREMFSGVIKK